MVIKNQALKQLHKTLCSKNFMFMLSTQDNERLLQQLETDIYTKAIFKPFN